MRPESLFVILLICSCPFFINNASAQCLYNSTHCTCHEATKTEPCLKNTGPSLCTVSTCAAASHYCDCAGTKMCTIKMCGTYTPITGQDISSLAQGTSVNCVMDPAGTTCINPVQDHALASPTQTILNGKIGFRSLDSHKFSLKAFTDENNVIATTPKMEGKWPLRERLHHRYIHVRLYYPDGAGDMMVCVIYNKYEELNDGMAVMRAASRFTTNFDAPAKFVVCDDKDECNVKAGDSPRNVYADHRLTSSEVDGFCGGPFHDTGVEVAVKLSQVSGFKGIILQSPGDDTVIKFENGAAYDITGKLDSNGLIQNGDIPSIFFNMNGY